MLESLKESDSTFTQGRVEEIFREQFWAPFKHRNPHNEFKIRNFDYAGYWGDYGPDFTALKRGKVKEWCTSLHSRLKDGRESHLRILDSAYAEFVECRFNPQKLGEITKIAQAVCAMLTRLPVVVPEMQGLLGQKPYAELPSRMFLNDRRPKWETLRVARYVSRNIISMALEIRLSIMTDRWLSGRLTEFVNLTMLLLRGAIELSAEEPSKEWFLIKSFLWTSWQRAATLHHYHVLERTLRVGWDRLNDINNTLQGMQTIRSLVGNAGVDLASQVPPYMCRWAFRLLRADKSYIGQDLRRFFERFSASFDNHTPRCMMPSIGSPTSCDGIYPAKCLRLSGLVVENQSAHTRTCDKHCSRLYWDKSSWTKIGGGAAVLIDSPDDGMLMYCEASAQTMAVSHVWSHGQGGRPENNPSNEGTGLNSCLHKRFSLIARYYGCDSYWLDTACIPSDRKLRGKAIANINRIFADSKLTLVCDRDLMTIDIAKPDIASMELILATILVCDWNVRAWTLLEALRARHNIHILCKNNRIIALKEVVNAVLDRGCIDIAAAFLSAQHLLPWRWFNRETNVTIDKQGFVPLAVAADLLSHRHASRPGDEIVIWGLLMEDDVSATAEQFWRVQEGRRVPTGFLVSDHPRIAGTKGLSWAPIRPNFPLLQRLNHDKLLYPYGGEGTVVGQIERGGLDAVWSAHQFKVKLGITDLLARMVNLKSKNPLAVVERLATQYSQKHGWCALLQPLNLQDGAPILHPRRPHKDVFVVVGSHDGQVWTWLGLLQVEKGAPLPGFAKKTFLIA